MEAEQGKISIGPVYGNFKAFGGQTLEAPSQGDLCVLTRMKVVGDAIIPHTWEAVFVPDPKAKKITAHGCDTTINFDISRKVPCVISHKLPCE